jgi:glycosyltransferase involved in cell wall biosynthesis
MHLYDTPNSEIPYYLNAADLLLVTSYREGSVNVVKEAMACNCPIVSTDVGDVRWVMSGTEGCYISAQDHESVAGNIKKALAFGKRTNGRDRILELGLDSVSTAQKIIDICRTSSRSV